MKTESSVLCVCLNDKPFRAYETRELAESQVDKAKKLAGLLGDDKSLAKISIIEMDVFSEEPTDDG
jgi:hypothetical protein